MLAKMKLRGKRGNLSISYDNSSSEESNSPRETGILNSSSSSSSPQPEDLLARGVNSTPHQINSASNTQLQDSSHSTKAEDTSTSKQTNGCRGAGEGVAVVEDLSLNLNTDGHANQQQQHLQFQRKNFSGSNSHTRRQQQHGIRNILSLAPDQHHKHPKNGEILQKENIANLNKNETRKKFKAGDKDLRQENEPLDFSVCNSSKPNVSTIHSGNSSSRQQIGLNTGLAQNNNLSMKSPSIPEDMAGTVLNLSKESPTSTLWQNSEIYPKSPSHSLNPNSTAYVQSNSPRPATIPLSMTTTTNLAHTSPIPLLNGVTDISVLPPWGSGVYSPSISPILSSQTLPNFETSPGLFPHHVATAGATSPPLPFVPALSLPLNANGSSPTGAKGKATRPFKAYPKDPLSFSSVGLYGLPLGTSPTTTEAVIHQQSNQAYAEFRKQMLSSSKFGKSKRGGHRNQPYTIPGDSRDGHCSDGSSVVRTNDSESASDDGNSQISGNSKLGKSEQQLKDKTYWERRRKNNEAAKRSRDARRAKEDEIAIRAAFLEQENLKLRFEVCALKSETAKLRCMLYSS